MDEKRQGEATVRVEDAELEMLVRLVEERVVENLTRIIERIAQGLHASTRAGME